MNGKSFIMCSKYLAGSWGLIHLKCYKMTEGGIVSHTPSLGGASFLSSSLVITEPNWI
jgi:hypothetical protein